MSVVVVTTFIYLLVAFALVILVIPQWQSSGQEYLEHVFSTSERAEAVNRLMVTGLSLITLSLALLWIYSDMDLGLANCYYRLCTLLYYNVFPP